MCGHPRCLGNIESQGIGSESAQCEPWSCPCSGALAAKELEIVGGDEGTGGEEEKRRRSVGGKGAEREEAKSRRGVFGSWHPCRIWCMSLAAEMPQDLAMLERGVCCGGALAAMV